jgi:competence protein ComEC
MGRAMKNIAAYPLIIAAVPLAAGILLSSWGVVEVIVGVIAVATLLFHFLRFFVVILSFTALGVVLGFGAKTEAILPATGQHEMILRVEKLPEQRKSWHKTEVKLLAFKDSTHWMATSREKLQLYADTSLNIALGDTLLIRTRKVAIDSLYRNYFYHRGITGTIFTRRATILGNGLTVRDRITLFSERLSQRLASIDTSTKTTALVQALTVGDRSEISREQRHENSIAGTAHLLAVSGLHVGIVMWFLSVLLGWIKLFRRTRWMYGVVIILLLWGYAAITGFSPSVARATVMFSLYMVGKIFSRSSHSINTLMSAALLLLLWNPNYIYDIGFQLSMLAMVGITTLYYPIYCLWKNRLWSLVAITISAQILTLPLACYYFGVIPLVGIVLNIALWAVVPVIIVCSVLFLVSSVGWIGATAAWAAELYNAIVGWSARQPFTALENIEMPVWLLLAIYSAIFLAVKWNLRGVLKIK